MEIPEQLYAPEYVDEQIEVFLQSQAQRPNQTISTADLHLLHDLRRTYQSSNSEDVYALERVKGRLLTAMHQQEQIWQDSIPYPEISTPLAQKPTAPITMHNNQHSLYTTKPRQLIFQRLSVLVATIIVFVAIGSTITVFNNLHHGSSPRIAAAPTVTPSHTPIPTTKVGQIVNQMDGHLFMSNLNWSPDGTRIAGIVDGDLQSWDSTAYGHVLIYKYPRPYPSNSRGDHVLWSPNGKSLAVIVNAAIFVFDATTTHLRQSFSPPSLSPTINPMTDTGGFIDITWSPDSRFIAAAYPPNKIFVWNTNTGSLMQNITNPDDTLRSLVWSPDGTSLAAVTYKGKYPYNTIAGTLTLRIWDTTTWRPVHSYADITDFSWSHDGKQIAVLDESHTPDPLYLTDGPGQDLRIIDSFTGHTIKTFAPEKDILAVHWSPDGTRIALEYKTTTQTSTTLNTITSTIKIWSVKDANRLYTFPADNVNQIFWSPNSRYIISIKGGAGGEPLIWAAE